MPRRALVIGAISGLLVSATAHAREAGRARSGGATPPSPPAGAPPAEYYLEPAEPAASPAAERPGSTEHPSQAAATSGSGTIVIHEPPPPPEPRHRTPKTSLWTGARLGWFFPFGSAWLDGYTVDGICCNYQRRPWSDYASSGPHFELDVGARLGRYYNLFALYEHAVLGPGKRDADSFGGQKRGHTELYALGFRFSSNPDDIGLLLEIALGYRRFVARWSDGTRLALSDGLFDARVGLGADIRLSDGFALSPLVSFDSGVFTKSIWSGDGNKRSARTPFDQNAQYAAVIVSIGAHFDIH